METFTIFRIDTKSSYRYSRCNPSYRYPKKVFEPVVRSYKQPTAGSKPRSVVLISSTLGYSRQYYYKHCKEKEHFLFQQQQVKQLADKERKILPRIGGKKIYHQIQPSLQDKGIKMGRDKLLKLFKPL